MANKALFTNAISGARALPLFVSLPRDTRCFICQEALFYVPTDSDGRFMKRFHETRKNGSLQRHLEMEKRETDSDSSGEMAHVSDEMRFAVSACKVGTHVLCAEPCATRFCAITTQHQCPICRGELSAPLSLAVALCENEKRALHLQNRLRRVRLDACEATERTFAQIEDFLREHMAREPLWNITPTVGTSRSSAAQVGAHRQSHNVQVTFDSFAPLAHATDSQSDTSITWTRQTPRSAMSSSQTLRGPWPAIMSENEVLLLCEQTLGVQLRPLTRGGTAPRGLSSANFSRLKNELLSEINFATRQNAGNEQYFDMRAMLDEGEATGGLTATITTETIDDDDDFDDESH